MVSRTSSVPPASEEVGFFSELLRTPYARLCYDEDHNLVLFTRLPPHWASLDELHETFARMDEAIASISKERSVFLIDSREGPLRNDPAFEAAFEELRRRFNQGFRKIAALVKTVVGRVQIQRHSRNDQMPVGVFTDVAEALAYLELPPTLVID